jgi:hypothetical protein
MANECVPEKLSSEALSMIKPLISLRIKQTADNFTEDGRWRGPSKHRLEVENRFFDILKNKTNVGDEAVVYLLNVYMGSHPGEEVVCEAINRGKRLLPLIKKYKECIPEIGLEPLPKGVKGSGHLPIYAIKGISKGEKCEHH